MKSYTLSTIKPGIFFSKPVYLDKEFLLLTPEMQVTEKMIEALNLWGYKEIFSNGELRNSFVPEDGPLTDTFLSNDAKELTKVEGFLNDFQKYVEDLFTEAALSNMLEPDTVIKKVQELLDLVREKRIFVLRVLMNLKQTTQNYLVCHTVKSSIIALVIGLYLKLPTHQLIELGIAAVVHEIGMIKIPPQVYMSRHPLMQQEKRAILAHPVLGCDFLKFSGFSVRVCTAVLEHHERENGSGYPQRKTGDRIGLYAKIIAIACSYDALTADRPHKEFKDGFMSMLDLLKNENKRYDERVIRALVCSLSLYPIGSYVLLSNNKTGQVIDVKPETPRYPIVQVFNEMTPDRQNVVLETARDGVFITKIISREAIA
ncbi:MAG: HD-GYP domain-containing protein [Treponema sp.]|jgi:HD-GYP domain-containing protein (c-di-GMP phosphodiesterase class II)|nr:HD-GYP domain-containing protein [Treponema sp.]